MDLGTIAAYDISPLMMNLYGLEQPLYFQLLNRQLQVADRANTRGTVMNLEIKRLFQTVEDVYKRQVHRCSTVRV